MAASVNGKRKADVDGEVPKKIANISNEDDDIVQYLLSKGYTKAKLLTLANSPKFTQNTDDVVFFDPSMPGADITAFLKSIDDIGIKKKLLAADRIAMMKKKIAGAAETWYWSLDKFNYSWEEWKKLLINAFGRNSDYCALLTELLGREKKASESYGQYFREKLSICIKASIFGQGAVDCLIAGLPEDMRSKAKELNCKTPDELNKKFLSTLDKTQNKSTPNTPQKTTNVTQNNATPNTTTTTENKANDTASTNNTNTTSNENVAQNANEVKTKTEAAPANNEKPATNAQNKAKNTPAKNNNNNKSQNKPKCYNCQQVGHISKNCNKKRFSNNFQPYPQQNQGFRQQGNNMQNRPFHQGNRQSQQFRPPPFQHHQQFDQPPNQNKFFAPTKGRYGGFL